MPTMNGEDHRIFSNSVFFQLPGWILVSGVVDCFQNTADVQKEAMLWPKMQKPPHGGSMLGQTHPQVLKRATALDRAG